MPVQGFGIKDSERFRKIVSVMEGATIEGEKHAAREAAERMAESVGMTLEEAILETHPERDDGTLNARERQARKDDFHRWAAARSRMTATQERAERQRYEQARREAEARGLKKDPPARGPARPRSTTIYTPSRYRATPADRFRMISGLLKEGASLRRVADLADVSTNEVARIWLLIR